MSAFEFAAANRIIFGAGKLNELGALAAGFGTRPLVVCGRSSDAIPRLRGILSAQKLDWTEFPVHSEPSVDSIRAGLAAVRGCDMVIGLGGGSVLDTGKTIAILATNKGGLLDYLEVIGKGRVLTQPSLPYIAIPTTAGTGTEVTRNAVIESPEHQVKVSLRSPFMLPRIALVDPELTYSLPSAITASTGLDALTQLIEPFVSIKSNPLTDAICREGMRHAARSLQQAYENSADAQAREGMSLASLFGGLALANAGLGTVHGFAGPLGGMLHAPHGAICARLLPFVMEANIKAMEAHQPNHPALKRYEEVAQTLTGDPSAIAKDGVTWVSKLVSDLKIKPLSAYGLTRERFPEAVEKTMRASSTKGNPIELTEYELTGILEQAI
jgi:alcohol dehydrogenase class IV